MTERTATPQYDFYATRGSMTPVASQFGSAPSQLGSSPSRFGSSAAPTAPAYGSPPGGEVALNQFGTSLHLAGAPVGPSTYAGPAVSGQRSGGVDLPPWVIRMGVPLVIAAVLGLFGVGKFGGLGGLFQDDLEVPATLAGMPLDTTSEAAAAMSGMESELQSLGDGFVTGFYHDGQTGYAFLFAVPEQSTAAEFQGIFANQSVGAPQPVGDATCAPLLTGPGHMCARTGDGRTLMLGVAGTDPNAAALVLQEAWGQL